MAELNFDSSIIDPVGSFDPLPLGKYTVVITASENKKANKPPVNGIQGEYLQLTYEVIEGEYKDRKVFERLNLVNGNAQAQEIAQQNLSAICRCVGVIHPNVSEELHDIPMIIKVGIRPASENFGASNEVKGHARVDGKDLKDITDGVKVAKAVPAAGEKKPKPWQKKN